MPTYEYECTKCRRHFERHQHITDAPIQTCPECGGQVRRVFYPVGVIFKGSGFYVTDNRRGSNGTTRTSRKDSGASSDNGKGESSTASTGEAPKSEAAKSEGEKAKS
jgi:putative FmdB family regulatory protein